LREPGLQHAAHIADQLGFRRQAKDGVHLSVTSDGLHDMALNVGDGSDDLNRSGRMFTCYGSRCEQSAKAKA
jgi:hypothetical protein